MSSENMQPDCGVTSRPARRGKASVVLGVISPALMILCACGFLFAMFCKLEKEGWVAMIATISIPALLLGFLASPVASLIGICLAVASLFGKNCRRRTSVVGLVLNVIAMSVFVLMFLWCMAAMEGIAGF